MSFRWDIFIKYLPILAKTSLITLQVIVASVPLAALLGLALAALRMSNNFVLPMIARVYITVIRGIPLLVYILWIFFGLTLLFGFSLGPMSAGILIMSTWGAAYFAEIFRSGMRSIEKTQHFAAYSLGMTRLQCFLHVFLPQAFRRIVPPFISQVVVMTKSSALLSVINVQEITKRADTMSVSLYAPFEIYLGAAVVYFIILFTISRIGSYAEKKLRANVLEA